MNGRRSQGFLPPPPRNPSPPGPTRIITPGRRRAWQDDERAQLLAYHNQGDLSREQISNLMNETFAARGPRTYENIMAELRALRRGGHALMVGPSPTTVASTNRTSSTNANAPTADDLQAANILMHMSDDTASVNQTSMDISTAHSRSNALSQDEQTTLQGLVGLSRNEVRFPTRQNDPFLAWSRSSAPVLGPNAAAYAVVGWPLQEFLVLISLMCQFPNNERQVIHALQGWEATRGLDIRLDIEIQTKIVEILETYQSAQ